MQTTSQAYQIHLKQGDLKIELSSDDVYFISRQMDKWFKILLDDRYVPVSNPYFAAPPKPEQPIVEPVPEPQVQALPEVPVPAPAPPTQLEIPLPEPIEPPVELEKPFPFVANSPGTADLEETVKDDFEAVMDSIMEDLEKPAALPEFPVKPVQPSFEPSSAEGLMIDSLSDLCEKAHPVNAEDFLLLSAYYITFFDGEEKLSLKRINSLMVQSNLTPVNHSVVEFVLAKAYLEMIPDMTGLADVTEYRLTEFGQAYTEGLF